MNQSITIDLASTLRAVEAAGLFSSVCTFQEAIGDPDDLGQSDLVDWTDVAGLVDIPCMMAPLVPVRPSVSDEQKMQTFTKETTESHLLLDGYFPQVLQRYRVIVDGAIYTQATDVMGVESDSQKVMTRCAVKRVSL
jgi:hypothetical protein